MTDAAPPLALDGYTPVPAGKIASVATFLEMRARPAPLAEPPTHGLSLRRVERPDPGWYRALFRRIGEEWLWFSRLRMDDAALTAILHDADVEVHALSRAEADGTMMDIGLLELDFRDPAAAELAFFGLVREATGAGAGRMLINAAIARAFARPVARFFVHTCTLDSPAAVGFYQKAGFVPVARAIEIVDDPRLDGTLPRDAAPQFPIIAP